MNKIFMTNMMVISCVIGFLASTFSTDANADYSKRANKWESSFKMIYAQDATIDGHNGSETLVKSDFGWGFTLGYNLNQHVLLNYDFSSTTPSYNAHLISDNGAGHTINHKMNLYESQFNVVYNVLTSSFTPYVQAGMGWSFVDSNIADGPPVGGCWSTWWGTYCDSYQNTHNDIRFSYNAAVGFRYELPNHLTFKVSYKQSFIDLSNSKTGNIGSYHLEIGSIF